MDLEVQSAPRRARCRRNVPSVTTRQAFALLSTGISCSAHTRLGDHAASSIVLQLIVISWASFLCKRGLQQRPCPLCSRDPESEPKKAAEGATTAREAAGAVDLCNQTFCTSAKPVQHSCSLYATLQTFFPDIKYIAMLTDYPDIEPILAKRPS